MGREFRRRVLSCLQLYWASRLYLIYLVLLSASYIAELLLPQLASATYVVLGLWFLPALAASIIARRRVYKLRDEDEAILAYVEFVGRHGYFCAVAKLTVEALALFGASVAFAVVASIFFRDAYLSLAYGIALFAVLYSWTVSKELERLKKDLELLAKVKRSYERIKI